MFKNNKEVRESTIDTMKEKAMKAGDYSTLRMLMDVEDEMCRKLFKERMRGIFGGYGTAMAGVVIGVAVVKYKSKG